MKGIVSKFGALPAWGKVISIVLALMLVGSVSSACSKTNGDTSTETQTVQEPAKATYTTTSEAALKALDVGKTAVFEPYEVTIVSVSAADGKTVVSLKIKAHDESQKLATRYLQTESASELETSFPGGEISCAANSEVTGTITLDSDTLTELRWNNWDHEATWKLPAKQEEPAPAAAAPAPTESVTVAPPAEPEPEASAPVTEPQTITVYVTNTGEKYHSSGCQYLRQSRIEIDLDSAIAQGYTPCSKCNPPR